MWTGGDVRHTKIRGKARRVFKGVRILQIPEEPDDPVGEERKREGAGERWIGLKLLSLPVSPVAAAPTRSGHTARLHFRDGWKFPF